MPFKQRLDKMSPPPSSAASPDFLPYGRQLIGEFEAAVCAFTGVQYGVAVSSGTAALHAAMYALGIGPGDEVIVPAMTFAATANCVVYQGGTPVFADVEPDTLLIDPMDVARRITAKTRAIIAVDYAGQPCDYYALRDLAQSHGLALVADACHSLGGSYKGKRVGTLADLTVFSFHPVKHITTGEGGMVVTDNPELAARMRRFRNHGIDTDHRQREASGTWAYQMVGLGYNYRLTDLQAALGTNQLAKLPGWLEKRRVLAAIYDAALAKVAAVRSIVVRPNNEHAYHLYVVRLVDRDMRGRIFAGLRQHSIGANVHYLPVHLHPYYREVFHTVPGLCPNAEAAYDCILTLPLHQGMDEADVDRVVHVLKQELVA